VENLGFVLGGINPVETGFVIYGGGCCIMRFGLDAWNRPVLVEMFI